MNGLIQPVTSPDPPHVPMESKASLDALTNQPGPDRQRWKPLQHLRNGSIYQLERRTLRLQVTTIESRSLQMASEAFSNALETQAFWSADPDTMHYATQA